MTRCKYCKQEEATGYYETKPSCKECFVKLSFKAKSERNFEARHSK
jgi:hypothetical protein